MATSIFSVPDHNRNNNLRLSEDQQTVKPRRKSSSKAKEINKKKPARRGMGVEKLERLINNNKTCSPCSLPFAFIPTTSSLADPVAPVPLPFSRIGGMVTGVHSTGGGLSLIPQQLFVHKMGINGARAFYPNRQVCDDKFQGQVSCVIDNVKGNSKQLPSIPNLMQCDYCADCYKKKRGVRVTGNEMVFDGVNPSFQDTVLQGAKVVAFHKNASTIGQGNHVVMEYEFFPGGKSGGSSTNKTHQINYQADQISPIAMRLLGGEAAASCLTTTTTATTTTGPDDASTYIDLSLKLSY